MNDAERTISSAYQDQRLLKAHGFDHWPGDEELVRYLFSLEEKIDFLAHANGIQFERDVRGRLHAYRKREVQQW